MPKRWIALIITVASLVAVGTVAPGAWAAGRDGAFYGDLDGDGLTDRVTLASVPPEECAVVVEPGRVGGGYEPPVAHAYPKPGEADTDACPDLGTVLDLGGDGTLELVVAWFDGAPPGVDTDLLVLRDFQPAGGFAALNQPSYLGSADFNADKRRDIYQWSDIDRRFATFLNIPDGRLVPGPMRFCGEGLAPVFKDFNRNGAMDMVTSYREDCAGLFSGVVVVLDDGTEVDLSRRPLGGDEHYWTAGALDANADGRFDVRTTNLDTGDVVHWIGDGAGGFTESPTAVADTLWLDRPRKTTIDVLANDAVTTGARLEITVPARYGVAQLTSDRKVVYTPHPEIRTPDRFVYRLTQDGKQSTTSVYVRFRG